MDNLKKNLKLYYILATIIIKGIQFVSSCELPVDITGLFTSNIFNKWLGYCFLISERYIFSYILFQDDLFFSINKDLYQKFTLKWIFSNFIHLIKYCYPFLVVCLSTIKLEIFHYQFNNIYSCYKHIFYNFCFFKIFLKLLWVDLRLWKNSNSFWW